VDNALHLLQEFHWLQYHLEILLYFQHSA
jgi:hypothetical protein